MTNTPKNDMDFIQDFQVGDQSYKVDALILLSVLTLSGSLENPTPDNMIEAIKKSIRPRESGDLLNREEAYALSLRVMLQLRELGKLGAP